jgi:cbb3-type cytochrome oxidase cytochrome c subunit
MNVKNTLLQTAYFILLTFLLSSCISYNGEKLFKKEECIVCHSFNGIGGRMGPDLTAISNIRSDEWINGYIQNPKKMNPMARMPAFPHLSRSKRKSIIAFLNR